jgi:hypothetical protein
MCTIIIFFHFTGTEIKGRNIKNLSQAGVMVYTCNLSYLGDRGRRITVRGWPGQIRETLSEKQTFTSKKKKD